MASCRANAAPMLCGAASHRCVEPAMSVNRNVTVPDGGPPPHGQNLSPPDHGLASADDTARLGPAARVGCPGALTQELPRGHPGCHLCRPLATMEPRGISSMSSTGDRHHVRLISR